MNAHLISNFDKIIASLIVLVCGLVLFYIISKVYYIRLKNILSKSKGSANVDNSTSLHMIFSILRVAIIFVVGISILSIYNINLTATVTGLGIISAVLGFALQDSIKDIVRGISMMGDKFFLVGDVIEYEGDTYEVVAFTLRSTKLRDIETGNIYTIFNGNISEVKKISGVQFIDVPLSYSIDLKLADETFRGIVEKLEKIDGIIMCSYKGIDEFAESSMKFRVKVTSRQSRRQEVKRAALWVIKTELDNAGIVIPFNQLDVHLDNLK